MTTPDTERLDEMRSAADAHLRYGGGGDDLAHAVLELLNTLDAVAARFAAWTEEQHRVSHAGAVDEIAAIIDARERAESAETRIRAARDVLDRSTIEVDGWVSLMVSADEIRAALDGDA